MEDEKSTIITNENLPWKIKNLENRLNLQKQTLSGNRNDLANRAEEYLNALRNWRTVALTLLGTSLPLILFGFPQIFTPGGTEEVKSNLIIYSISIAIPLGTTIFIILSIVHHKAFHLVGSVRERYGRVLDFITVQQDALLETTYESENVTIEEINNFDSFMWLSYLISSKMIYEGLKKPSESKLISKSVKNKIKSYMTDVPDSEFADSVKEINFKLLPGNLSPWVKPYVKTTELKFL